MIPIKLHLLVAMEERVEVLLEYKESRRQLSAIPSKICDLVSVELGRLGIEGAKVILAKAKFVTTDNSEMVLKVSLKRIKHCSLFLDRINYNR